MNVSDSKSIQKANKLFNLEVRKSKHPFDNNDINSHTQHRLPRSKPKLYLMPKLTTGKVVRHR